jgi:ubiquinone/menaquinone biosynthesis C-methylase UbiE
MQAVVTRHWDDRAPSYLRNSQREFQDPRLADRWRVILAEAVGQGAPRQVLDAGCGPGHLARLLAELGHEVTAVDVSREMLARAAELVGSGTTSARMIQADVTAIPLPAACVDCVVSRYVLWTLPDPAAAVREWYRLLRPGGRVIVIDGSWYRHYYRHGLARVYLQAINLLRRVRSGCDPSQKLAHAYAGTLPATPMLRPDWDLGLLAGVGFLRLTAERRLNARLHGLSWRRLESFLAAPFVVVGTKPDGDTRSRYDVG